MSWDSLQTQTITNVVTRPLPHEMVFGKAFLSCEKEMRKMEQKNLNDDDVWKKKFEGMGLIITGLYSQDLNN